jgi:hypothetical protein
MRKIQKINLHGIQIRLKQVLVRILRVQTKIALGLYISITHGIVIENFGSYPARKSFNKPSLNLLEYACRVRTASKSFHM